MALTRYKILKRGVDKRLTELGTYETNGPKAAMRQETDPNNSKATVVGEGESLVAVPAGNWTEQGARLRVVETLDLFDLESGDSLYEQVEPDDPGDAPIAA